MEATTTKECVLFRNVDRSTDPKSIIDFLESVGPIEQLKWVDQIGYNKWCFAGWVTYQQPASLDKLMALNYKKLGKRPIKLQLRSLPSNFNELPDQPPVVERIIDYWVKLSNLSSEFESLDLRRFLGEIKIVDTEWNYSPEDTLESIEVKLKDESDQQQVISLTGTMILGRAILIESFQPEDDDLDEDPTIPIENSDDDFHVFIEHILDSPDRMVRKIIGSKELHVTMERRRGHRWYLYIGGWRTDSEVIGCLGTNEGMLGDYALYDHDSRVLYIRDLQREYSQNPYELIKSFFTVVPIVAEMDNDTKWTFRDVHGY